MADDELKRLREELQTFRDLDEIRQLRARYVRYVDDKQWEAWGNLLTEDFYFDSDGGVQEGRDVVVASVSTALADASTVHHVFNPEITITGPDTASAIWPMEDWVRLTFKGKSMAFHGMGHYRDDYVRTPEGWRIKRTVMSRIRVDPIDDAPAPG
jgi:3-phenylpropionate/cinnamic acid dioxygenase small subunit